MKIAIIGAGPGGYWASVRAAQLGAEVTVIEREKAGGTCLHWGCIPSKVLIHTSRSLDMCRRAKELGILLPEDPGIEMGRLMQR
ncbi:MAG: FAD-dependent oxidoreductase, partial [Thermodesulfobacteriota bacterium]